MVKPESIENNVSDLKRIDVTVVTFNELDRWQYCQSTSIAFSFDS